MQTVLAIPFDTPPPYAPVDEDYRGRPESPYSLSKLLGEEMARQFCRWNPDEIIGLRFSNVMEAAGLCAVPAFDADARLRKWNLWAYIDARDAAQAIRKAIEAPIKGAEIFIIEGARLGAVEDRLDEVRSQERELQRPRRGFGGVDTVGAGATAVRAPTAGRRGPGRREARPRSGRRRGGGRRRAGGPRPR